MLKLIKIDAKINILSKSDIDNPKTVGFIEKHFVNSIHIVKINPILRKKEHFSHIFIVIFMVNSISRKNY